MKKILLLGILLSFLFASHSFAAYTLTPSVKGNIVTATLTGATDTKDKFKLLIQTTPFPAGPYIPTNNLITGIPKVGSTDPTVQAPDSSGVVTWSLTENYNTTYYIRAVEISIAKIPVATDPVTIKTPQATVVFSHLTTEKQGGTIFVEGKIDPVAQPDYQSYRVYLTYSKSKDLSNPIARDLRSHVAGSNDTPVGISDGTDNGEPTPEDPAGSYYWALTGLTPGATYYMQQTFLKDAGNIILPDEIDSFNADTGTVVPPTSTSADSAIVATGGYKLLSGFPGFTFMPDPAQCAQQRADAAKNHTPPPKFCDINDVLNYALQLMIGLSAVVLVFRLMYEGYMYMVSDVPFLKASAKSGFFTALLGLLLALSSYVILNTINPKLVNESINVQQLSIGVDTEDDGVGMGVPIISTGSGAGTNKNGGSVTLALKGGGTVSVANCDTSQIVTIPGTVFGKSGVRVQKNLVASLQRIDAAWQKMNPRYDVKAVEGYNCRPIAGRKTASYHGYGLAVDINPDTNGRGTAGDMPTSFVNLWKAEGWGWGGNWSYTDPMHFSKGINEKGNLQGE